MCYIHYFNISVKQKTKGKQNLLFLNTTGDATETLVTPTYHLFESGGGHTRAHCFSFTTRRTPSDATRLCNSSMLTCCLTAHELRTPCTSQSTINDNSANFRQFPNSIHPELCAYRFPFPWITEKALKWKALPTWWWNESQLYRCMQTLGPYSFSAGIEQVVHYWDKCPTGRQLRKKQRLLHV
jgi:hypothetical protein